MMAIQIIQSNLNISKEIQMKKILIFLLLLVGGITAQTLKDVVNSTDAVLNANASFSPAWKNVSNYSSVSISIRSDKNSAINGIKIYWATLVGASMYRIMDSLVATYTAGIPTSWFLNVSAPYLKVKYTNGSSTQTLFSVVTMLHSGIVAPINSNINTFLRYVDTWGSAKDTSTFNFNGAYLKGYITLYDSVATADTLVFEKFSYTKNDWTTHEIGFRDVSTDYLEADNSTVIIPASTAKTYEINLLRPTLVRIRPKTLTGRTTMKTKRITFIGIN